MISIPDSSYTSDLKLSDILYTMTKAEMLKTCNTLDLYVSPNLNKDKTSDRLADEILRNPTTVLCSLNKQELEIIDEFAKGGRNTYVSRKERKTHYKLQKYGLVVTHCDTANSQWNMLMPDEVRESLLPLLPEFLDLAKKGQKPPTPKQLRMMSVLQSIMSGQDDV